LESFELPRVRIAAAAGECGVKDQVSRPQPFKVSPSTSRVKVIMSVFSKVLRAGEGKRVRQLSELVGPINELSDEMAALSDGELRAKTDEFRARIDEGEDLDDLLIEAFAVVREASTRVLGQRHYDVQLMGGMALHFGWIAEMKTGEGKTLVSTLPVYLNALSRRGVHVVTSNDYLASRDAEWMGRLHRFLGITVGRIGPDISEPEMKKAAYECDVTYGTNSEFGFDYLRDNMARSIEGVVQRGHVYAIIDEVDSILIDEARTPLIISGPSDSMSKLYYQFASIARSLVRDEDYEVDEEKRTVVPLESGIEKVERALGVTNLYDAVSANYVQQLLQALNAKELYHRDKEYLVEAGEVKIIDPFTGRTMADRRWSDGLHQAVEAKERVKIKEENHTWATVTIQNYFRMYEKLAGMTGTAETEAAEFSSTYGLSVVPIPTNKPSMRIDEADLIFKTEGEKFTHVVDDVIERHEKGQPVLLGTASVEKSEALARALSKVGLPFEVLNAKQHFREAEIVAQAGRKGAITVATNMAGRGVDIVLGGNPEGLAQREVRAQGLQSDSPDYEAAYQAALAKFSAICAGEAQEVLAAGGLYVLGTERHESRRIDNQLRGRCARQGDPGESRFYLSLEDDLMRLFATGAVSWVMDRAMPEGVPIEAKMVSKAIERAQSTVEGKNAEERKEVLKYDDVRNEQRKVIYARRQQIIAGDDLLEETLELIDEFLNDVIDTYCPTEYYEEWDTAKLFLELQNSFATTLNLEQLTAIHDREVLIETVLVDAHTFYEKKCLSYSGGEDQARAIEREVMLQLLDQRWQEHLGEMDHLHEGIFLRAHAQQDPLVAWQRDGYAMFERLLETVNRDFGRYILQVQEVVQPTASTDLDRATTNADVVDESVDATYAKVIANSGTKKNPKSPSAKLGRNDPCFCGSGRKYKQCHGRP
jgi:preprotein translocase subunit SecA